MISRAVVFRISVPVLQRTRDVEAFLLAVLHSDDRPAQAAIASGEFKAGQGVLAFDLCFCAAATYWHPDLRENERGRLRPRRRAADRMLACQWAY